MDEDCSACRAAFGVPRAPPPPPPPPQRPLAPKDRRRLASRRPPPRPPVAPPPPPKAIVYDQNYNDAYDRTGSDDNGWMWSAEREGGLPNLSMWRPYCASPAPFVFCFLLGVAALLWAAAQLLATFGEWARFRRLLREQAPGAGVKARGQLRSSSGLVPVPLPNVDSMAVQIEEQVRACSRCCSDSPVLPACRLWRGFPPIN